MYLSYLIGADRIRDEDLKNLSIDIVEKTESGNRKLKIPSEKIEGYKSLLREKMNAGFWNEFLDEIGIYFIFKLKNGEMKEFTLSPECEQEIDTLCSELNDETPSTTSNVYKYISDCDFYHDLMLAHYKELVER